MSITQEENYQAYQEGSIDAVEYAANHAVLKLQQYRLDNPYGTTPDNEISQLRHWLFCLKNANLDFDMDKAECLTFDILVGKSTVQPKLLWCSLCDRITEHYDRIDGETTCEPCDIRGYE